MNFLYLNPGARIKSLAKSFCLIGMLASIIVAIVFLGFGFKINEWYGGILIIAGIVLGISGIISSYFAYLFMAAFGDIAANTNSLKCDIEEIKEHICQDEDNK